MTCIAMCFSIVFYPQMFENLLCWVLECKLYIVMSFGENKTGVAGQHRETAQQIGLNEIYVL